jgi:hypothetical protein
LYLVENSDDRGGFVMLLQNWTPGSMVGPIQAQLRFNLGRAKWPGGEMVQKGKTYPACGKR